MSGEVSVVFTVEADEEFYEESRKVVWVYIFNGRGWWRSWIHITPIVGVGVMVRVFRGLVGCSGRVGLTVRWVVSPWFILHSLFALCKRGCKRLLGGIQGLRQ